MAFGFVTRGFMAQGFVQTASTGFSVAASYLKAYTSNNTAGNLLIAFVNTGNSTTGWTFSDTQGNSWTTQITHGSANPSVVVGYAFNCKAGANTVTATNAGTQTNSALAIFEYGGPLDTVDAFASSGPTTTTSYTTPSITTTSANDTIFAFSATVNSPDTVQAPFTSRIAGFFGIGDDIVSSAGSYSATFNVGVTGTFNGGIIAFSQSSVSSTSTNSSNLLADGFGILYALTNKL